MECVSIVVGKECFEVAPPGAHLQLVVGTLPQCPHLPGKGEPETACTGLRGALRAMVNTQGGINIEALNKCRLHYDPFGF